MEDRDESHQMVAEGLAELLVEEHVASHDHELEQAFRRLWFAAKRWARAETDDEVDQAGADLFQAVQELEAGGVERLIGG